MKTITLKLSLLILTILLFSACSPEDDGIYFEPLAESKITYTLIETEILLLVNDYRIDNGLSELKKLNIVSTVAETHTNYMVEVGKVNHDNFPERHKNLVENANAKSVGENVAYGYSSAESVVNAWLNSDHHREIIEDPEYTHFGISTETDANGRNYFTHIFINK
jgi:uncharacterized protein YkwD